MTSLRHKGVVPSPRSPVVIGVGRASKERSDWDRPDGRGAQGATPGQPRSRRPREGPEPSRRGSRVWSGWKTLPKAHPLGYNGRLLEVVMPLEVTVQRQYSAPRAAIFNPGGGELLYQLNRRMRQEFRRGHNKGISS